MWLREPEKEMGMPPPELDVALQPEQKLLVSEDDAEGAPRGARRQRDNRGRTLAVLKEGFGIALRDDIRPAVVDEDGRKRRLGCLPISNDGGKLKLARKLRLLIWLGAKVDGHRHGAKHP
jgi:hypothetical protein